jgi:hypothetical protein
MERSTAVEIINHLKALDDPMNAAMAAVEKIQDMDQRRIFRRPFSAIVGEVYSEIYVPIGREFPELLPDQQDLERTQF